MCVDMPACMGDGVSLGVRMCRNMSMNVSVRMCRNIYV